VADEQPVARFLDPWTLVYERTYPHPIERVFEAVSTGEHLDAWFIPTCTIERKVGGACSFTWGGPPGPGHAGTVTHFDPPRLIRYTLRESPDDPEQYLQFELEATADGTRLRFTHAFRQGSPNPWRTGFTVGFHSSLGLLGKYLHGIWTRTDMDALLASFTEDSHDDQDTYWKPIYGELIRTQWPAQHIRREGDETCPAVEAYLSAIIRRSEDAIAALRSSLADDVVYEFQGTTAKGRDEVLEAVMDPKLAGPFSDFLSTEVDASTSTGTVAASVRMPQRGSRLIGFDYTFELRDRQLTRIRALALPAPRFVLASQEKR
jgi:uncharacterized protein YndB with AHSA1/START domain